MSLEIAIDQTAGSRKCVALSGRLDNTSYMRLDHVVAGLWPQEVKDLVLDIAELQYISSAGIRSIFKMRKRVIASGGKLVVVNPQVQVRMVFDMVRAVPFSEIFSSVIEADMYLDIMQRRIIEEGPQRKSERCGWHQSG